MRCKDAQILINEYLDGTLNEVKREALFAHIHSCTHCKEELEQLTALKNALKDLPDEEPPKGLLSGAIEKVKSVSSQHKTRYFPQRAIAGIAAAVVITIGAVWYFSSQMQFSQGGAEKAKPKAQMMTAMEAPAQTPATLMQEAPMESAVPSASMAASSMPPAAGTARNGSEAASLSGTTADSADMEAGMAKNSMPQFSATVEKGKAPGLHDDLKAFLDQNNIPYTETKMDDADTVSFTLYESIKNSLEVLLNKYAMELNFETPVEMNFVFKNS